MENNSFKLSSDILRFIVDEVEEFNNETNHIHGIGVEDVLYTLIESTDDILSINLDWDEGKDNDPYWDEVKNMHSCISFLDRMYNILIRDKKLEELLDGL